MALHDLLTRAEVAVVLGVEERTITNYQKLPTPIPTERRGRNVQYPLVAVVAWWVQHKVDESRPQVSEMDVARQRREVAGARKLELEVEELEGSRMPVSLHEQRLRERCEELAGRVKGLNRWVPKIRAARTEDEADTIADRMEDELLAALRGAADEIPDDTGPNGDGDRARAA
jgi:phage terminase Nu1 subunit (DNA packaging protein)